MAAADFVKSRRREKWPTAVYLYQKACRYFAVAAERLNEVGAEELAELGAEDVGPEFSSEDQVFNVGIKNKALRSLSVGRIAADMLRT